jgi:hypothetical protein
MKDGNIKFYMLYGTSKTAYSLWKFLLILSNRLFICLFYKENGLCSTSLHVGADFYWLNERTNIILQYVINFGVYITLSS